MGDDRDDDGRFASGHDEHFLLRVADENRVDWAQAELALRLYRSPGVVRALLAEAPPDAERIAVPLGGDETVPHVIVARDGAFATLLGDEMSLGGRWTVPFERVRLHFDREAAHNERRGVVREVLGDHERLCRLFETLLLGGARLAREDFAQLAVVAPLFMKTCFTELSHTLKSVREWGVLIRQFKRIRRSDEDAVRCLWRDIHCLGHLIVLLMLDGKRSYESWQQIYDAMNARRAPDDQVDPAPFFVGLLRYGGYVGMRALWALARAGRAALPTLKAMFAEAWDEVRWRHCTLGLVAIAQRHRGLRAEIARSITVARMPEFLRGEREIVEFANVARTLCETELVPADAVDADARRRDVAESVVLQYASGGDRAVRGDDCSIARMAQLPFVTSSHREAWGTIALAGACVATAPAEELYFPREHLAEVRRFTPEAALLLANFVEKPEPAVAEKVPGRNEACSCGSGRKYKKCCGR